MKPLIISLGNRYRQDDNVGPYVLNRLKERLNDRADFLENGGDTAALLDAWQDRQQVYLIDAFCDEDTPAGTLYRLNGLTEPLPNDSPVASSHVLPLASAIELGKLLQSLPHALTIYAVCGKNFSHGEALSAEVQAGAEQAVEKITQEFNASINPIN